MNQQQRLEENVPSCAPQPGHQLSLEAHFCVCVAISDSQEEGSPLLSLALSSHLITPVCQIIWRKKATKMGRGGVEGLPNTGDIVSSAETPDGACAAAWSAICLLKPCNSISGHPTHSGRGAEMCHPLITAFQVLVKFLCICR